MASDLKSRCLPSEAIPHRLLEAEQVAEMLCCSRRHVYRLDIPFKKMGSARKYQLADVVRFIDSLSTGE